MILLILISTDPGKYVSVKHKKEILEPLQQCVDVSPFKTQQTTHETLTNTQAAAV